MVRFLLNGGPAGNRQVALWTISPATDEEVTPRSTKVRRIEGSGSLHTLSLKRRATADFRSVRAA
jgi:hypothetical protein